MTPTTIQVSRALAATLSVQAVVTMATLTVPVFAPAAAADIGLDPSNIGIFASIVYFGAMVSSLLSGGLAPRYGAIRVSQAGIAVVVVGMALTATASWQVMAASALMLGLGLGPATPASSHILARTTPAHLTSFVFSIKQTGVPLGGVLAGALVPLFVVNFGWRGAALAVAAICLACAVLIQPARRHFDTELRRDGAVFKGSVLGPLRLVLGLPELRRLAFASFVFAAIQQSFSVFLVTYLVTGLGMPFVKAGITLSIAQAAGVAGRVVWGALADWTGRPQLVLGGLGLAMTAAGLATSAFTTEWSYAAILTVCIVFGATAVAWNGVFLAEVARLAPDDQASRATGGVLFFTFFGVVAAPPVFGTIAALTGSYGYGFIVLSVLTGIFGVVLVVHRGR
jgi:MFS family permease